MKLVMKQNLNTEAGVIFQNANIEVELKVSPEFAISEKAVKKSSSVASPVDRKTVMLASSLIQDVMLMVPVRSVHTQANIQPEKAIVLLAE